jgi:hypothetical protein
MITQEQAKQILVLASSYASVQSRNEMLYSVTGYVSNENEHREKEAWEKLERYVKSLVSEEQQPCTKSTTCNGTSG